MIFVNDCAAHPRGEKPGTLQLRCQSLQRDSWGTFFCGHNGILHHLAFVGAKHKHGRVLHGRIGQPLFERRRRFAEFVQSPCCIACWALAKRDGKTRPTVVMAENNLQFAANLLDEPEDEFHPEPSLKSGG